MKNFPLLWKIYDHIVAHPEEWNQESWATGVVKNRAVCATAFCVAGHAIQMGIPEAVFNFPRGNVRCEEGHMVTCTSFIDPQRDGWLDIENEARQLLGLTIFEGAALFNGDNELGDIHRILTSWELEQAG